MPRRTHNDRSRHRPNRHITRRRLIIIKVNRSLHDLQKPSRPMRRYTNRRHYRALRRRRKPIKRYHRRRRQRSRCPINNPTSQQSRRRHNRSRHINRVQMNIMRVINRSRHTRSSRPNRCRPYSLHNPNITRRPLRRTISQLITSMIRTRPIDLRRHTHPMSPQHFQRSSRHRHTNYRRNTSNSRDQPCPFNNRRMSNRRRQNRFSHHYRTNRSALQRSTNPVTRIRSRRHHRRSISLARLRPQFHKFRNRNRHSNRYVSNQNIRAVNNRVTRASPHVSSRNSRHSNHPSRLYTSLQRPKRQNRRRSHRKQMRMQRLRKNRTYTMRIATNPNSLNNITVGVRVRRMLIKNSHSMIPTRHRHSPSNSPSSQTRLHSSPSGRSRHPNRQTQHYEQSVSVDAARHSSDQVRPQLTGSTDTLLAISHRTPADYTGSSYIVSYIAYDPSND